MPVAIAVTEQAVYPPRITVSVTGLTVADVVSVTRTALGTSVPVRAFTGLVATASAIVKTDAEQPFGVPSTYAVTVNGVAQATAVITSVLPGGQVVISDAITGLAVETVITAWPDKQKTRDASVFQVGGRNVVVSGYRAGFSASVEVMTETDSARRNLGLLLDRPTSGVLTIRQAGGYDGVDSYVTVLSDTERRWSQDGSDPRRLWTLETLETQAWADTLDAQGFTLQNIADAYVGLTLTDLSADYATLLAVANETQWV